MTTSNAKLPIGTVILWQVKEFYSPFNESGQYMMVIMTGDQEYYVLYSHLLDGVFDVGEKIKALYCIDDGDTIVY